MKRIMLFSILTILLFAVTATAGQTKQITPDEPQESISRYPIPKFETLPEDIKKTFLAVQESMGFIPNVFFAMAHRPDEFRAYLAYGKALMKRDSGLTPAEKEMIVLATSNDSGCQYCVISHGASLRIKAKDKYIAEPIAINYREAPITPRQKAMIDFAMKVSKDSRAIAESDFHTLQSHGFSKEDVWDIAGITAFFGLSNRMMNFAAVHPDEEFYMMGR
ncbi:peroxidase-related enzyme [Maridesulfovibrio sp.]|uniref:peroxidase-related enzyme n=1 Tax=unclassified Maridesulfovibrio TaxID=2794999 RepID=UPI003AFFC9F2